ncbi:MAG: LysE family transporter [Pseudomonadota bacterium]|nr:LysE family transporter [Pseudomonadota bacterium]
MSFFLLGFFTGLSLILALGAQNIFVIEQGLKKNYIFIVCLICSISDLILIFLGIFLFNFFENYLSGIVEFILNILLLIFLIYFIFEKVKSNYQNVSFNKQQTLLSFKGVIIKTLGFTYLNPHVYSDTVFFLGNFSKNFEIFNKYYFGFGAATSSFIFFFLLGYLSKFFSKYLKGEKIWKYINNFIIIFMSSLCIYILNDLHNFIT